MAMINIGKDFHTDPAGRFYTDGEGSGEDFRENKLLPTLQKLKPNEKVEIILDDDVEGYGSSFLVEGFAGIVKYGYMRNPELLEKLQFHFQDPDFEFYKDKIIQYINEAKFSSLKYVPSRK